MKQFFQPQALVVAGPTGAGKTKLAVRLARLFRGEIISADSRQVYKGMDVGTGKDLQDYSLYKILDSKFNTKSNVQCPMSNVSVPYHCIDIVSPNTEFNAAKWLKCARRALADIQKRGKLPIIAGGTGLYLQALVEGFSLGVVKPNAILRQKLEQTSLPDLQKMMRQLDPSYTTDTVNRRHLIRYLEIITQTKKPLRDSLRRQGSECDYLVLGLTLPRVQLNQRINNRLQHRLEREGMLEEVRSLHARHHVSWKRLESFGLEYAFVSRYLQGKLTYDDMAEKLAIASRQFAKRQLTWLKRWERQGRTIHWVKNFEQAKSLVQDWQNKIR